MGRLRGKCGKTRGICRAPPAPGIGTSRSAPPAPPCASPPRGNSPIARFTLLQSVPNILPPEPIINKESSIGIGSTSLPSLRNYAALSRSFLGQIRFQNRPRALPRRRGNVVMGAWQRCYGGVATLLWGRGNVVTGAWQRCYGAVATLLRGRGNVVMGPWQPMNCHAVMRMCLARMDLCPTEMNVRG